MIYCNKAISMSHLSMHQELMSGGDQFFDFDALDELLSGFG